MIDSEVIIYTDGSCFPNPGPGGWGSILLFENDERKFEKEISGGDRESTNNRMEMQAVIGALEALKRPCNVKIYSDSQYVVKGVGCWINGSNIHPTGWMVGWERRGWKRKDGPLKNSDLWKKLHELVCRQESVQMVWVKGHDGNELNERCDVLALKARTELNV